ncbi:MAG: right-handed parallel beta-helix repeat-containing protein [Planctomycetes bacterium]|nr:right-handed parallel beta-helix repeat-containing protein [Planctomycetota bacterium]MBL7043205.1 right-handed parallel beta-helix repeat-containing protein [Pirellulaceae bacterium]
MNTNLCSLLRTTILLMGSAVLFTVAAYAEQADDVGQNLGCGEFTTREPAQGEIRIDKAPFVITQPGEYIVTKDLAAEASAIAIQADNVTLDLNGHTVKYGCGVKTAESIMTYTSRRSGNIGHAGVLLPGRPDATADFEGFRWNSRRPGIVVKNGTIADGAGRGLSYSAGIQLAGAAGATVENVRIEIAAPDTFGLVVGKDAKVRHVTINNKSTHVSNRHAQMASIQTSSDCEVSKCLVEGGPQIGVKAGSGTSVHHNIIRQRATVTNCYGVAGYRKENVRVFNNKIMSYNGRGIHLSEKSSGWLVHDNYVEVRETRNKEYRRMQTHGIKLEGTSNSKIYNNVVLSISSDGGEPTALNMAVKANASNEIYNNTFIALTINEEGAYSAYLIDNDASGSIIRDNTFYTNNICYMVSPDGSRNVTFRRCTFAKISPDDEVLFYANRAYKKEGGNGDRLIDCVFTGGIDPRQHYFPGQGASWRSSGDYTVGWSLTLHVTDGDTAAGGAEAIVTDEKGAKVTTAKADEEGRLTVDLPEFKVGYDVKSAKSSIIEFGPYTVKVTFGEQSRTLALTPKAPMSGRLDLSGTGGLILTPATPTAGRVSQEYRLALTGSGLGADWRIEKGKLPDGLTISDGVISGTPTTAGGFAFTLANGDASKKIVIEIAPKGEPSLWRKRAELALQNKIPGRVGMRFDQKTDR